MKHIIPSEIAHAPGPSHQDFLNADTRPVPPLYRENKPVDLGVAPIKASRYTSKAFFDAEVEKVWLKTWQYVCREEEVPNRGDTFVFDLVGKTAIVVRQADGSVRAFQNVCLHRGRKLVTSNACKTSFKCPYHGFTWNIDGTFRENPFSWDFPQIDEENFPLPEIRAESWAGFVFINFDAEAAPLADIFAPIDSHFKHWKIDEVYKAAHIGKVMPANWKVCSEAFLEAHHAGTVHPQTLPYVPCEAAQYDLLSDHVARFMQAAGMSGALWPGKTLDETGLLKSMLSGGSRAGNQTSEIELEAGRTARAHAADLSRNILRQTTGRDFSDAADADMIDAVSYDIFPNFHLWGGFAQKICYRFRPDGLNHERTLMEIMLFKLRPLEGPAPKPASLRMLAEDESLESATELAYLAGIYAQDEKNMEPVQQGLQALGDGEINFGRYQELRCRNLHRMIDQYMAR